MTIAVDWDLNNQTNQQIYTPNVCLSRPIKNLFVSVLQLLLKAKDYGSTRLEDTRFLTVIVIDVNDNRPYFKDDMVGYF